MEAMIWNKGKSSPLLVEEQTSMATMKINIMVPQTIGNGSVSRSSNTVSRADTQMTLHITTRMLA